MSDFLDLSTLNLTKLVTSIKFAEELLAEIII